MSDFIIPNNITLPTFMNFDFQRCGHKVIDEFISYTHSKKYGKMEFVPYNKFKDITFIHEGGFSKIYKATWNEGPRDWRAPSPYRSGKMTVALKELNDSYNINSGELEELYNYSIKSISEAGYAYYDHFNYISKYFGFTQNPITNNFMIITKYYESGDLRNHINNDFYNITWFDKLVKLRFIIGGLKNIHDINIIHRDYHSGNIFLAAQETPITGDLGLNKSALCSSENEIYGVVPYVAPEIFQGQNYVKASDIYSFGMIMWELMTGRRPFWDKVHDTNLIVEICDGLRPPIVTNAPDGYIELMNECWHFDPVKRPTASNLLSKVKTMLENEINRKNPTKIIESSDIGPVITNNPGAIYKSRPLSEMIKSAIYIINLRSLTIISKIDKRKFDDLIKDNYENDNSKKIKSCESENNDYLMELDIGIETNTSISNNNYYITKEICNFF
ncbi:uncharacterized protein OCT59_009239 [Rhizophagus irregularis]|uniref:Cdc15p n=2 Tax=Rhizophagus irregularis TaxID=588596 RepID=A0A015N662_RHIIW|nr:Cdc15p [Rhizophagus irregularis DAOM 197198w]UZO17907.1 hypothetical protein OCT59_009239 [Rhizophagus irregularis]GBC24626.2 kinase-like domain-containing protein [Rhizophagus irregularis DAOM 181602=DAOM 197198]